MKASLLKIIKESNLYLTITKKSEKNTKNTLVNTCDSMIAEMDTIPKKYVLIGILGFVIKSLIQAIANGKNESPNNSPNA